MVRSSIFLGALLGLMTTNVRANDGAALGVGMSGVASSTGQGALITSIYAGSPAAQVGLQPGDRILAINGFGVRDYRDVQRVINSTRPNAPISLQVARGAQCMTVPVMLTNTCASLPSGAHGVQPAVRSGQPDLADGFGKLFLSGSERGPQRTRVRFQWRGDLELSGRPLRLWALEPCRQDEGGANREGG